MMNLEDPNTIRPLTLTTIRPWTLTTIRPAVDPNYDPTLGGSTGGGVSSLSMIVRENGGEVSLSVNNVAPMYAANFADLDGQNIGGALVSIKPAQHPGRFEPRRQRRGL